MVLRPPGITRTAPLFPSPRLFRAFTTWGLDKYPCYYRKEVVLGSASIALAGEGDKGKVTLYGSNLTDQEVISGAISAGATPIQQFYQPPREFGVDVAFKF